VEEPSWDKAKLIEEVENRGFFGSNYIEIVVKDWFLAFEAAKAMPFFKELDLYDQVYFTIWICKLYHKGLPSIHQIALLQRIALPINFFCGSYFSYGRCSQTMCRANGLTPITVLEAKQYRNDKRLFQKWKQFIQKY
jgi:hypothetical protein